LATEWRPPARLLVRARIRVLEILSVPAPSGWLWQRSSNSTDVRAAAQRGNKWMRHSRGGGRRCRHCRHYSKRWPGKLQRRGDGWTHGRGSRVYGFRANDPGTLRACWVRGRAGGGWQLRRVRTLAECCASAVHHACECAGKLDAGRARQGEERDGTGPMKVRWHRLIVILFGADARDPV